MRSPKVVERLAVVLQTERVRHQRLCRGALSQLNIRGPATWKTALVDVQVGAAGGDRVDLAQDLQRAGVGHGDVVANLVLVGSGEDDRPHRSKDQGRGVGIPARVQNHDVTFADLLAHWHAR
jgi:hypothetical protein